MKKMLCDAWCFTNDITRQSDIVSKMSKKFVFIHDIAVWKYVKKCVGHLRVEDDTCQMNITCEQFNQCVVCQNIVPNKKNLMVTNILRNWTKILLRNMPKVKGKYIHFTSVKCKLSKIVQIQTSAHEFVMPYLLVTRPSRGDSSSKPSASILETFRVCVCVCLCVFITFVPNIEIVWSEMRTVGHPDFLFLYQRDFFTSSCHDIDVRSCREYFQWKRNGSRNGRMWKCRRTRFNGNTHSEWKLSSVAHMQTSRTVKRRRETRKRDDFVER